MAEPPQELNNPMMKNSQEDNNDQGSAEVEADSEKAPLIMVHCAFLEISHIDCLSGTVLVKLWLELYWDDPNVHSQEDINEDTWRPRLSITNADEVIETQRADDLPICNVGTGNDVEFQGVVMSMYSCSQQTVRLKNPTDLRSFPFDKDTFDLLIDGSNASENLMGLTHYRLVDCNGYRHPGISFMGACEPPISEEQEWRIHDVTYDERIVDCGMDCKQLCFTFHIVRVPYFYLYKIVLLLAMISVLGFGAYTYDVVDEKGDRLNYVMTTLLASSAFMFVISANLPTLAYLTTLDRLIIWSFTSQFLIGLATVVTHDRAWDSYIGTCIFIGLVLVYVRLIGRGFHRYKNIPILTQDELEVKCRTAVPPFKSADSFETRFS